ncbi:SDR family oxidoreductase [Paenibacillus sp. YYML68]|uniref:dTDP-4-dehydrorhamnose reductase family protein n=1 Tax=Paenibacillus sp. YYML68 TaxID=2909250 RepID=UPI002491AD30|nr:SDR family oxidoreductase [Paenibacillus sp. YYML68]
MRMLVIGGNGMAGHMLLHHLANDRSYELFYTLRERALYTLPGAGLYADVRDANRIEQLLLAVRPDVIVNAVGLLNDLARQHEVDAYTINGLLPHRLAAIADRIRAKVIHISTDCVFEGKRGGYTERHVPDGTTVYARTKALGEVTFGQHMTIRTSIIGPELRKDGIGLLRWFLLQQGEIKGYTRVPWNGVTTLELAKFIQHVCESGGALSGLVHLTAPETVSKYELLLKFQRAFNKQDVTIVPDDVIVLDRTLISTRSDLSYTVPSYDDMLAELRDRMMKLP